MDKFDLVYKKLIEESMISTKQAKELGVSRTSLSNWVKLGKLERVSKGMYILPNELVDTLYVLQNKCNRGVFSHETALLLHDFSDRTPSRSVMTVPRGYNTHRFKEELVDFHWVDKELLNLGVVEIASSHGNMIRVYDLERTICDVIKYRKSMDRSVVNNALRRYAESSKAKRYRLAIYAKKMGISKLISEVMEVLY